MIELNPAIAVMNDDDLLAYTRELIHQSCGVEAELLLYLGELDKRKLYAQRAFPSMLAFCVKELGFSEGAAYNRIGVARVARRLPAILDALRSGAVASGRLARTRPASRRRNPPTSAGGSRWQVQT